MFKNLELIEFFLNPGIGDIGAKIIDKTLLQPTSYKFLRIMCLYDILHDDVKCQVLLLK